MPLTPVLPSDLTQPSILRTDAPRPSAGDNCCVGCFPFVRAFAFQELLASDSSSQWVCPEGCGSDDDGREDDVADDYGPEDDSPEDYGSEDDNPEDCGQGGFCASGYWVNTRGPGT